MSKLHFVLLVSVACLSTLACESIQRDQQVDEVLITEPIPLEYGRLVSVTEHTELRRAALWFEKEDTISVVWVRIPRNLGELALPGEIHDQLLRIPRQ